MRKTLSYLGLALVLIFAGWALLELWSRDQMYVPSSSAPRRYPAVILSSEDPADQKPSAPLGLKEEYARRWKELVVSNPDDNKLLDLARQTAIAFSCSVDCLDLIGMIYETGSNNRAVSERSIRGASLLKSEIVRLFRSNDAGRAVSNLLTLASVKENPSWDGSLQDLGRELGKTLPEPRINPLLQRLSEVNLGYYQILLSAHLEARAGVDPVGALNRAVEELSRTSERSIDYGVLADVMGNIPPAADHRQLDDMLSKCTPADKYGKEAVADARRKLLHKWACEDPKEAMRKLTESSSDPSEIAPFISSIIDGVIRNEQSSQAGVDWIQAMPSGPIYDAAVEGIILHLARNEAKEARELISDVSDQNLKEKLFEEIGNLERHYKNIEKYGEAGGN